MMMRKLFQIFTLTVIFTSIIACKKDEESNLSTSDEVGFYFAENGSKDFVKADEAISDKKYNKIFAKKGSDALEFILTDLKVGTYSLTPQYAFDYLKDGKIWSASEGTLEITSNDGNKISGTFEATAGSGNSSISKVEGRFKDIDIQ